MADYDAGSVGSVPVGGDLGAERDPVPPKDAGEVEGIIGVAGGGDERIRDVPLLTRDNP